MKKIASCISILCLSAIMVTGCAEKKEEVEKTYGVDFESPNVLTCTNLNYNHLASKSSNILENHLYLVEYDENKTDIIRVKEVYTADLSKVEVLDDGKVEEFKNHVKERFCDTRKSYITPNDYSGEDVICEITYEDNIVSAVLSYPKDIIDFAVEKGMFGSLEEVKKQLENGEFAALKNTYFTCDKEYDKTALLTKELSATLNIKYTGDDSYLEPSFVINMLLNEVNLYVRFQDEIFKEYKVDTGNNLVKIEAVDYEKVEGDYNLTYSCVADSSETCDKVFSHIINYIIEDGKKYGVIVTKK